MPSFEPVDYDPWAPNPQAVAAAAPAMAPPSPTFDQLGRNSGVQAQNLSWPSAPGQPARVTVNPLQSDFPAYSPTIGTGPETTGAPSAGNRDYAGEITKAFNPETIRDQQVPLSGGTLPAPPAAPQPPREPDTVQTPLAAPAKMQAELANPYVMDRLIAMTRAEVGNLGPEGGQKFLETIRNRAMADGRPLAQILADKSYFPRATFRAASAPVSEREREVYAPLVEQMIAGSNSANWATGNASYDPVKQKWVGFQGGPQTATAGRGYGTELYGIEKPHLDWAKSVGYEGGQAAPYVSENETAFANAAQRTARGVRPEGGRQPGLATHFLETFFPTAVKLEAANQIARPQLLKRMAEEVIGRPQAALESAGSLQRGGSYDPAPVVGTAMGLMAPRVPVLAAGGGQGQAGIFGGRLAATADHAKLTQAENLHAQGVPMQQIRQQTGWDLGPDNKWRFEISDQNARVRTGTGPLPQQLEHPDLYAAYPHLRDVQATITEGGRPKGTGESYSGASPRISVEAPSEGQRKRIALHEATHLVQDREGFSSGADPYTIGGPVYTAIGDELSALAKIMDKGGEPAKAAAARYSQLAEKRANFDPYDFYHRQAGEVEARNVMERANWTAEERAMVDPRYTEDVPRDRQITQQPYEDGTTPRAYEGDRRLGHNRPPSDAKPVEHDPFALEENPGMISTRMPTAKKAAEDPFTTRLQIDVDAMKKNPALFQHNVGLVRHYPNMTAQEARLPVDQAADAFVNHVKDNLLWLHDQVPPEIAARSKLWYDGANRIIQYRAKEYGVPDNSVAGVYAAMSPQKDWFQNVSLGDRVMDSYFRHADVPISKDMIERLPAKLFEPEYKPLLDAITGKSLNDLNDPGLRALWIRVHDQGTREQNHYLITPEGNYEGMVKTNKGADARMSWGSLVEIGKALGALEAKGNAPVISRLMGERHKVRNFFNNLLYPNAKTGDVTIDTHAVAGGLLQPFGGKAVEVAQNFGNYPGKGLPSAKSSAETGVGGTYGLYADAYRKAATERSILPREMQSITWEAARGLFPDTFKTAKNAETIRNIWFRYRKGEIGIEEARNAINEHAGGINPPPWYKAP